MPLLKNCIKCDEVAVVLNDSTPYCVECYTKELKNDKSIRDKKNPKTLRKN